MSRYSLPLAMVLVLACSAIPSSAAQQTARTPQTKRVWTTDDMDGLRARGLISIVGTETEAAAPAAPAPAPAATTQFPVYASRTEDPAWYAEQAAGLQAQLSAHQVALAQARDNLAQARNLRGTTGSFNMLAGDTFGVTPEEVIAHLEGQVQETQGRLDELADLARRNSIPTDILRTAAA
jgi:hypothetical protein